MKNHDIDHEKPTSLPAIEALNKIPGHYLLYFLSIDSNNLSAILTSLL
ncbi:hypothetical protein GGD38_003365 [Chitinophagaceae bacterium OAS944]|nr:hypothetical protein [Chitinophagaceae bacterium OAS944]